jgi:hypothetical protein
MKQFRKCDTTKYRKQRKREKAAHAIHVARRRAEQAKADASWRQRMAELEAEQAARGRQINRLERVLMLRMRRLDPEYYQGWRAARQFDLIAKVLGMPTLDEFIRLHT